MPKVFKPRISLASQKKNNFVLETSQESVLSPVSTENITVCSGQLTDLSEHSIEESPLCSEKVVSDATNISHIQKSSVDIDDVSSLSEEESPAYVSLFDLKQPVVKRKKKSYGEPPPPADQPLDRSTVTLRSLLSWIPTNKPPPKIRELQISVDAAVKSEKPSFKVPKLNETVDEKHGDAKNGVVSDPFAPQVRLDADGNIVLDESSLEISRQMDGDSIEMMRRVDEESGIYGTTYESFRRTPRSQRGARWTQKDNTRFYRALSTIGTDFYCMTKIFPSRTRTQLMKKFKREERRFPHLVDDALKNKRNYDVTCFYNSEEEEEEDDEANERPVGKDLDALTQSVLKSRKRKPKAVKSTKLPGKRKIDLSAIIDSVLNDAHTSQTNNNNDKISAETLPSSPSSEIASTLKKKQPLLSEMIDKVGKSIISISRPPPRHSARLNT